MILGAMLLCGFIYLIIAYNQMVNLRHGISDMRAEMQRLGAESASLKDKLFETFDPSGVEALAKQQGLVREKKPSYLETDQWSLASHF
jgi:hypothetical protein